MNQPQITIRCGASDDTVTVDGVPFDRSKMKGPDKRKLRRMLVLGLTQGGYFNRKGDTA